MVSFCLAMGAAYVDKSIILPNNLVKWTVFLIEQANKQGGLKSAIDMFSLFSTFEELVWNSVAER